MSLNKIEKINLIKIIAKYQSTSFLNFFLEDVFPEKLDSALSVEDYDKRIEGLSPIVKAIYGIAFIKEVVFSNGYSQLIENFTNSNEYAKTELKLVTQAIKFLNASNALKILYESMSSWNFTCQNEDDAFTIDFDPQCEYKLDFDDNSDYFLKNFDQSLDKDYLANIESLIEKYSDTILDVFKNESLSIMEEQIGYIFKLKDNNYVPSSDYTFSEFDSKKLHVGYCLTDQNSLLFKIVDGLPIIVS